MQVSQTPTQTIAICATTSSEWDYVNFVILHLDDELITAWANKLLAMKMAAEVLTETNCLADFYQLTWFNAVDGWYKVDSDHISGELPLTDDNKQIDWFYVTLDPDDEENFSKPEQVITAETFNLNLSGLADFIGLGKQTGEEFETQQIPLQEIIDNYYANTSQQQPAIPCSVG